MKKKGKGFFLTLLVVSGIAILFLYAFFFQGKAITIFTFKQFVINKAFVQLLPQEYSMEEAEATRKHVHDFYTMASENKVTETALMQVSQKMRKIMADDKITHKEVLSLTEFIEERKPSQGR
jgi:hypothetical protein